MSAPRLAGTISCHAWNADRSMLAICPNSAELWIYTNCNNADAANWERKWVLKEHDLCITGMDWCHETNKIVTCGQDRNAFVWVFDSKTNAWAPQVVVLNINRAGTDVKWAPNGQKFAVSSGAKVAKICTYEEGNNWWIARETKKHKSTVLTVAWHPSSLAIATASTDYRCRVISALVEELDGSSADSALGPIPDLGEVMFEFEATKAWVNDCAWSPSGTVLAFAGHDSQLHLVLWGGEQGPVMQSIKCPGLPHTRALFLSDKALVAVGHGLNPEIFIRDESSGFWSFGGNLEKRPEANGDTTAKAASGFGAARAMFASKVSKGQAGPAANEIESWTRHNSAITYIQSGVRKASGAITDFSTSGNDGRVSVWNMPTLIKNLLPPFASMVAIGCE